VISPVGTLPHLPGGFRKSSPHTTAHRYLDFHGKSRGQFCFRGVHPGIGNHGNFLQRIIGNRSRQTCWFDRWINCTGSAAMSRRYPAVTVGQSVPTCREWRRDPVRRNWLSDARASNTLNNKRSL
jgi:hypothetical protein